MAELPRRTKVVRTEDGLRYEVETDERYIGAAEGYGELVRGEGIAEALHYFVQTIQAGLRSTEADAAEIRFGLVIDPEAGFVVSKGLTEAHIAITLDFRRDSDAQP